MMSSGTDTPPSHSHSTPLPQAVSSRNTILPSFHHPQPGTPAQNTSVSNRKYQPANVPYLYDTPLPRGLAKQCNATV